MATTSFVDGSTLSAAAWANDVDTLAYNRLTSPSGTNTVLGTGPASMTAYAAGQIFTFIPANTNTGATTLNITPSGGAALGAKNIYWNGAACAGGEIRQNVPAIVWYDGTQFNLMAQGGSINNTPIGATNAAAGSFTTVSAATGAAIGGATAGAGGLAFPATAVAVANVNTLDDYEEGTWTGALTPGTSGSITMNNASGTYVKVGRMVSIFGLFDVTSVSSPVGNLTLTGIPFAVSSGVTYRAGVAVYADGLTAGATTQIMGAIRSDLPGVYLAKYSAGAASALSGNVQAGSSFTISATYMTD